MPADHHAKDHLGILEGHTPAEPGSDHQRQEDRELVGKLTRRFDDAYQYRSVWERQWELSRLYLKGQQLVVRNRTTGDTFRLIQDDDDRLIAVNNILRPTARSLLGKLTRNIPTCRAIPPSADIADLHGTKIADSLLQFQFRSQRLDRKYIDLYRDVVLFGIGFMMLSWDKDAGQQIPHIPRTMYTTRS